MLWTVKQAARFLDMELHQTYYLLVMGEIEAIKIGGAWRLEPEAVEDYAKRYPERKNRKTAGNFIYTGDGGFLFRSLPDSIPPDPRGKAAGMERRRVPLVRGAKRPQKVLFKEFKPVAQLELFCA